MRRWGRFCRARLRIILGLVSPRNVGKVCGRRGTLWWSGLFVRLNVGRKGWWSLTTSVFTIDPSRFDPFSAVWFPFASNPSPNVTYTPMWMVETKSHHKQTIPPQYNPNWDTTHQLLSTKSTQPHYHYLYFTPSSITCSQLLPFCLTLKRHSTHPQHGDWKINKMAPWKWTPIAFRNICSPNEWKSICNFTYWRFHSAIFHVFTLFSQNFAIPTRNFHYPSLQRISQSSLWTYRGRFKAKILLYRYLWKGDSPCDTRCWRFTFGHKCTTNMCSEHDLPRPSLHDKIAQQILPLAMAFE